MLRRKRFLVLDQQSRCCSWTGFSSREPVLTKNRLEIRDRLQNRLGGKGGGVSGDNFTRTAWPSALFLFYHRDLHNFLQVINTTGHFIWLELHVVCVRVLKCHIEEIPSQKGNVAGNSVNKRLPGTLSCYTHTAETVPLKPLQLEESVCALTQVACFLRKAAVSLSPCSHTRVADGRNSVNQPTPQQTEYTHTIRCGDCLFWDG